MYIASFSSVLSPKPDVLLPKVFPLSPSLVISCILKPIKTSSLKLHLKFSTQ